MDKQIILQPNQPPQLIGSWTIGEVRQIGVGLLQWLDGIKLAEQPAIEDKETHDGA